MPGASTQSRRKFLAGAAKAAGAVLAMDSLSVLAQDAAQADPKANPAANKVPETRLFPFDDRAGKQTWETQQLQDILDWASWLPTHR
jgi:hypothetical protein